MYYGVVLMPAFLLVAESSGVRVSLPPNPTSTTSITPSLSLPTHSHHPPTRPPAAASRSMSFNEPDSIFYAVAEVIAKQAPTIAANAIAKFGGAAAGGSGGRSKKRTRR